MAKRQTATSRLIRAALMIFGYQAAFGFFGFMLTPALIGATSVLRIPLIGLIIGLALVLMFMEGSYRGERDCAAGATIDRLREKGEPMANEAEEEQKRYKRMRGVWTSLLGALPVLLIAVYVAATARLYQFSLTDPPAWLSAYMQRAELGEALAYTRDVQIDVALADYLRIAVRFFLFPYVGLFGTMSDSASLLFDRISPLLALLLPSAAAVGYQFGPIRYKKRLKAIEEAIRKPRKRLKKKRPEPRRPEKKQLI